MSRKLTLFFLLLPLFGAMAQAQPRQRVETSTDVLMFAAPAAALATTLALGDYKGTKQLVFSGATALAVSYILKFSIRKERPDGSNFRSFPSYHTAMAFQGASFVQRRYGWKYALPAYLVSGYVAWGRTYARRHDWWDVLGGAAAGVGSTYIFTRPYARKHNLSLVPVAGGGHYGVHASITF